MYKFLKKWLTYELSFFFWSCTPVVLIVLFGMFAVTFFPSYAIQAIGVFIGCIFILMWFYPRNPK